MKRAWGSFAVVALASGVVACSMLKKLEPADAGEESGLGEAAAAAPAASAATPEAVNASEMTRYPDEKPVDHAPITTEAGGAMRSQAGTGGDLVIMLKRGTEVEKLAEHDVYYLVLADDPKDPTRKLMGWIAESAFSGGAPHPNEPEHRADGGAAPPAPTAPPHGVVDAGTKPAPTPSTAPTPTTPSAPAKPLDVKKNNNTCPPGYASCGAMCRLSCKTDAECGLSTAHCSAGFCLGPGAVPCSK
jgi:hypothetical protein